MGGDQNSADGVDAREANVDSAGLLCYRQGSQIPDCLKIISTFLMNTTGKIQSRGQVTIPTSVRRQAGLSKGDLVNFTFQRGKIIITPRLVIDRSKFPTADDEYTSGQRR